jgi:hypothetical protein
MEMHAVHLRMQITVNFLAQLHMNSSSCLNAKGTPPEADNSFLRSNLILKPRKFCAVFLCDFIFL